MNFKLKLAREKQKLTQIEFSRIIGISERSYQRIEAGHTTSVCTAIHIARVLDSTVEELFGTAIPDNENTTKQV